MAANDTLKKPRSSANAGDSAPTQAPKRPRLRLKLTTIDDVKAEMARLYREGKAGARPIDDVSKLANILSNLGRLIVNNELAERIEALERHEREKGPR